MLFGRLPRKVPAARSRGESSRRWADHRAQDPRVQPQGAAAQEWGRQACDSDPIGPAFDPNGRRGGQGGRREAAAATAAAAAAASTKAHQIQIRCRWRRGSEKASAAPTRAKTMGRMPGRGGGKAAGIAELDAAPADGGTSAGGASDGKPPDPSSHMLSMVDHKNGRYTCTYTAPTACGPYELSLIVNGEAGPTQPLLVVPGAAHPQMITLELVPAEGAIAGEPLLVNIRPHDVYGNPCALHPNKIATLLDAPPPPLPLVEVEEEDEEDEEEGEEESSDDSDESDEVEREGNAKPSGEEVDAAEASAQAAIALGESAITPAPRKPSPQRVSFITQPPEAAEKWPKGGAADGDAGAKRAGAKKTSPPVSGRRQLRIKPQADEYGPLSCRIMPRAAGAYNLAVELAGTAAAAKRRQRTYGRKNAKAGAKAHVLSFVVSPAPTSPRHCILIEQKGEKGLCKSATPPREFLLPRDTGYDVTLVLRDRFGNRRPHGKYEEVHAKFALHAYGDSSIARKLKMKIAPLEPKPPTIVDRATAPSLSTCPACGRAVHRSPSWRRTWRTRRVASRA